MQAIDTVQGMVSPGMRARPARGARCAIESGLPLSDAFEANGLTTPISLRMLRVGERTGEMGPMLTQSAAFYDGEISRWIDRFTRTFEPLLMAAIGLVVGAIVVLLYMPIFDLAGRHVVNAPATDARPSTPALLARARAAAAASRSRSAGRRTEGADRPRAAPDRARRWPRRSAWR